MTVTKLRDEIIRAGIASVLAREHEPFRRRGGLAGFEMCKTLETPEAFVLLIDARSEEERKLRHSAIPREEYWEHRMATIQVEFVWERLKVAWNLPGPWSARAAEYVLGKLRNEEKSDGRG